MKLNKTIINYGLIAAGAFLFSKIYSHFGHGVASPWMSNLYLCFLGLGVLVFLLFRIFIPGIVNRKGYRLFYNTYNSAIAFLADGMLLRDILEIAGGTSAIVPWFLYIGCGLIAASGVLFYRAAYSETRGLPT